MAIDYGNARANRATATSLDMPATSNALAVKPTHPLDSEPEKLSLKCVEGWWLEQIDAHALNRREQLTDHDFYDHEQFDFQTLRKLAKRHQAANVFNLIHPVVDWIVGTERRTRVDWGVYPRNGEAQAEAEAKQKLLKFVSDSNGAQFARSKQFKDAVIGGVGWIREFAQQDKGDGIPVGVAHVNWKSVRWDPYSLADDLSDCRSTSTERYLDLDYAIAMFPHRAEELRSASMQILDPSLEFLTDDAMMPQMFFGQRTSLMPQPGLSGMVSVGHRQRSRVRLIETEYRRPITTQFVRTLVSGYDACDGIQYDPTNADLSDLLNRQQITLEDKVSDHMWAAIWHPGFFCSHIPSPYKHDGFSLTPCWAYRRHRDGMPYGMVRGLRDPQEEYNKRRSKALFALSTNRVIFEEDAIAKGVDEDDFLDEVAKPDGALKVASGALSKGAIKIEGMQDMAEGHIKLMAQAKEDIYSVSSVTPDNLGMDSNAISGRAILAKQQQGAVGTAELFDNYRQSIQWSGQKALSLTEQYVTQPMQIRVLGEKEGAAFLAINQPILDPISGQVVFHNDITKGQADFVVDEQDYRETVRMAMAENLMDVISKMPPEISIQLLDLAIDLTDIPNRQEFVARIRQLNGADKRGQALTPEEQQAQQDAAAQAQQDRELMVGKEQAGIRKDNAAAMKLEADAGKTEVTKKGEALKIAHAVGAAPAFAPAADRIADAPMPPGVLMNPRPPTLGAPPQPNGTFLPNPAEPPPSQPQ